MGAHFRVVYQRQYPNAVEEVVNFRPASIRRKNAKLLRIKGWARRLLMVFRAMGTGLKVICFTLGGACVIFAVSLLIFDTRWSMPLSLERSRYCFCELLSHCYGRYAGTTTNDDPWRHARKQYCRRYGNNMRRGDDAIAKRCVDANALCR